MKKLAKFISQNKIQFFFFVGLVGIMIFTIVISFTTAPSDDTPSVVVPNDPTPDNPVDVDPVETIELPFSDEIDFVVVRKFYEKDAPKEEQKQSLIKYQNGYRTSVGTSYAQKNGEPFDVLSVLSGRVVEIKSSPLYNNYVVVEHDGGFMSYYYGLNEVTVTLGSEITQGTKLGVSGKTEIDAETGNHVYVKFMKNGKHYNPEKLIGKNLSEIE